MFDDILAGKPAEVVDRAVYLAIRQIRHKHADMLAPERTRKGKANGMASLQIGKQLVQEVEKKEKKKLPDISDKRLERYIVTLSNLMVERAKSEVGADPEEGRRLLEELRQFYPG